MPSDINISYHSVDISTIKEVILCDSNDNDYQKYMNYLITKPKVKNEKYLQLYNKYKTDFDNFHKTFLEFNDYLDDLNSICGSCTHCSPDKFGSEYVCWHNWILGRPPKIKFHQKACLSHNTIFRITDTHTDKCLRISWEYLQLNRKLSFSFHRTILTNILRDVFGVTIEKIKIGKEALEYEKEIIIIIEKLGLPILPNVLKYWVIGNNYPKFKKMDCYTQSLGTNYVIEIFTQRDTEEKYQQVTDYQNLLKMTGIKNIERLLVSEYRYYKNSFQQYPMYENAKVNDISFFSKMGLFSFFDKQIHPTNYNLERFYT